ncbi:hypothetical protein V8G54_035547 [Vigna mungo]|uniref:Uncharacterized protein n=1 Tax=Vigna mungo TaxID=3915 RepID=A0AAQ3RB41_VIGMU
MLASCYIGTLFSPVFRATSLSQVNMSSSFGLDCPSSTAEERGQEMPTSSSDRPSVAVQVGIPTNLHGSRIFVHGGVAVDDPAEPSADVINYDWASRDVNDISSSFTDELSLEFWIENSCVLRSLDYAIMGKKKIPVIDWFNCSKEVIHGEGSSGRPSGRQSRLPKLAAHVVVNLEGEEDSPSQGLELKRKRKVVPPTKDSPVGKKTKNIGKGQATEESTHPEADPEKKVLESTSRQQLTQNCLELCARATASVWQLVHTADKEKADLESLQQQLMDLTLVHSQCGPKYESARKTINDGRAIFEGVKKSLQAAKEEKDQQALELAAVRKALDEATMERNTLKSSLMASEAKEWQMAEVIVLEHTRGFKKAIRQTAFLLDRSLEDLPLDVNNDVLGGKIIPSKEVPAGTYPDDEEEEEEDPSTTDQPEEGGGNNEDPSCELLMISELHLFRLFAISCCGFRTNLNSCI